MKTLNEYAKVCHEASVKAGWWTDLKTGLPLDRNRGELGMLIVTEISEMFEGERKNLMDDHLPHRRMSEVECADAMIRLFDYAGAFGFDLDATVREKLEYNRNRPDHKIENRLKPDGKKF